MPDSSTKLCIILFMVKLLFSGLQSLTNNKEIMLYRNNLLNQDAATDITLIFLVFFLLIEAQSGVTFSTLLTLSRRTTKLF